MTVADAIGNVVATTQTINNLFGAKILIPGLGTVPNNYMYLFDPRPGHALSLAPGKRVTSSMSPVMALRDGKLVYALGLPGGKRIFPSAMQALINLIDHGMSLQEAVEAPRVWTEGNALEVEQAVAGSRARRAARRWATRCVAVPTVAGGMNAIQFHDDGRMTGAACWRADGTPIGLGGGLARARRALRLLSVTGANADPMRTLLSTAALSKQYAYCDEIRHSAAPKCVLVRVARCLHSSWLMPSLPWTAD